MFKVVKKFPEIYGIINDKLDKRELLIYIEKTSIMKKHMEEYLTDSMVPYYEKVKRWKQELEETLEDAKNRIK